MPNKKRLLNFRGARGMQIMLKGNREQNIKKIITMEDRVISCKRCKSSLQCIRKPSLGKGDLEPEVVLVFESDNNFTSDIKNIIEIRKIISTEFNLEKVYHTFLVRCQPKACPFLTNTLCHGDNKLVDKEYNCILNNKKCSGIPIRPTDEHILSCLPYVVEEIEILKPVYLFLFGERVANFMLRSWGLFEECSIPAVYNINELTVFMVDYEEHFNSSYCRELKVLRD